MRPVAHLPDFPSQTASASTEDAGMNQRTDKKPVDVGMTSEIKSVYREDPRGAWEEWAPGSADLHSRETSDSMKFALIVRRELRQGDTGAPILALHSIVIQSRLIRAQLAPVFAGYPGINMNLKKIEFSSPFHEFFYRWSEFVKARPRDDDSMEYKHYMLLFDIVQMEVTPHINQTEDLLVNGSITFDYLWAIFEPGSEIYSRVDGCDRIFHLTNSHYLTLPNGNLTFVLRCRFIDTDGDQFGFLSTSLMVDKFGQVQPISGLSVIPLHQKMGVDEIRRKLEQRGRKFEALAGCQYRSYSGFCILNQPPPNRQYLEKGRVMIDRKSYERHTGGRGPSLEPLYSIPTETGVDTLTSLLGLDDSDDDYDNAFVPPAIRAMKHLARRARRGRAAGRHDVVGEKTLTEAHYLLCTPLVRGFCLKTKKWVSFYVDGVTDVEWNDAAFSHLVLPSDYKRVIWAFVEAQLAGSEDFDDVIKGKGKGMIMLLAGEPGTGKTLTSESVAESLRRPLYSMTAGELGNTAAEVEGNLQGVLELSAGWGAVLLIDECDVFLERRSSKDLHRNQLVSVFLRLLEYYQGVMFLTTNRADSFDPAFESRIHLTIQYPHLDAESRLHIWKTFVKPLPSSEAEPSTSGNVDLNGPSKSHITDLDLERFAQEKLNGRQIKNVIKTARLLAASDKTALLPDHVETVLRIKRGNATFS
ncbi:P-loop containing nucleoside triphosphate hydrolase protein [Colletotrichum eremochloae]|nr:P-loop containing nucleoside triphosphate hydrolase protein [Colletotrichum eremochloae]